MDLNSKAYISLRGLLYIPVFLVLHYLFEWFPNAFFQIISQTEESVFQSCKTGFFAYLLFTLLEFGIFRKQIRDVPKFWWTRLMGALILPWFIFIFWYTAPVVYSALAIEGFIPMMWLEILYANICVYLSILFVSIFEGAFQDMKLSTAVKICLLILLFMLIMEFTIFSFRMPWADMFLAP
jgi:hypothetical protein